MIIFSLWVLVQKKTLSVVKQEGRESCLWQKRHWEGNLLLINAFNQLAVGRIQGIMRSSFRSGRKSLHINGESGITSCFLFLFVCLF